MRNVRAMLMAMVLLVPAALTAQRAVPVGISRPQIAAASLDANPSANAVAIASTNAMPRWLKWGIVGAVAGAVIWTAAEAGSDHAGSVVSHALAGAVTGFIIVGGGVAVYDAVCDSRRGGC